MTSTTQTLAQRQQIAADHDEKGNPYVTPVVELVTCTWCNAAVAKRAKGRTPRFCSPECRLARHRAQRRVDSAYAELLAATEALQRGLTAREVVEHATDVAPGES